MIKYFLGYFATAIALALFTFAVFRYLQPTSRLPLPPGPKAPFFGFGNVNLPKTYSWKTYAKWKEIYGDVIYAHVWGNPVLILNSAEAARDLLEKRGSNYSSRPIRTMQRVLMRWDWLFSGMAYGDEWRNHRHLFHQHFYPNVVKSYQPIQLKAVQTLLVDLLDNSDPDRLTYYVRTASAAITLMIAYGHQVTAGGDKYVALADEAFKNFGRAGIFGPYLVDYLPILAYIPVWLPGAKFKRDAREWSKASQAMVNAPFDMVKQQMIKGTATQCLAVTMLENLYQNPFESASERTIRNVSGIIYAAGADTTVSAIMSFFLAMTIYPEVQKKAQEEMDRVVGKTRLPTFEDRPSLPYIDCLVLECLRWNPVTPLAVPHATLKDDIYRGMRIPGGTTVLPNVWAMLHDKDTYPDPFTFNPDRFIGTSPKTTGVNRHPKEAWGFGRRLCPGRHLADATVWLTVVSVLATFDITKAIDEHGNVIEPVVEYSSSLLSHPKPFRCNITPRSATTASLIRDGVIT